MLLCVSNTALNYFAVCLKRLLSVAYSQREITAQMMMPRSMETAPLSIPPTIPKKAIKRTRENAVFSSLIATEQVSIPMMAQITDMKPSPKRWEGIELSLLVFDLYPVFS